jgi:lipid-binding SYLF domain-containing protein
MKKFNSLFIVTFCLASFFVLGCSSSSTKSGNSPARTLEIEARQALADLYRTTPSSRILGNSAKAIMVFPSITKGGFVVGGQYGRGVLFKGDMVSGYYSSAAASWGLQAGIQKFGYALFFTDESDIAYMNKSDGWEIGVGPSITIVDEGIANSFTTTTARKGVYAFFFEQRGLMAGLGIQGTKISRIDPNS